MISISKPLFLESRGFKLIQSYLITWLGLALFSLGWTLFLIPAGINSGGISGIGMLIYYSTGLPVGVTYFGINAFLILIAFKHLGKSFGYKTLINMAILSLMLTVMQEVFKNPVINDTFLSAVLGGMAGGVGLGLVFSQGGSTGGTDIIAMLVTKHHRISPGRIIMYCDVVIITSSWFVFHSAEKLVYGFVAMWVVAYSLDAFLTGSNQSAQIMVFSKKWEQIRDHILHQQRRGVTVLDGKGGYTNEPVKIVLTVVRKREISSVFKAIKEVDDNAFISMGSVMGVYGEGFDSIKS